MSRILVVDDEPSICWGFRELLTDEGHDVDTAASAEEALAIAEAARPDAVILDVRLPGLDGLSAMAPLRERTGDAPIVVITAFGDLKTAVDAVDKGAFDYLTKPFDLDRAAEVIRRALERSSSSITSVTPSPTQEGQLLGASPPMQEVFKQIALAAGSDVPVLITGESGTGKELVARAIHVHSARRTGPFVPVCPAALSPTVIESELFGHVRGAFTGADRDRPGLLELAQRGTVLLDEIGDLPTALQVKLLRALEQREITPVGSTQPRSTDFRIVAATNRPLAEMIRRGEFREDLFFRLSVFQIELPPLRNRPDDIPLLAESFLQRLSLPHAHKRFTNAALDALKSRPWRGNVRELRNAVERAAIMARGELIEPEHLPPIANDRSNHRADDASRLRRLITRWTARRLHNKQSLEQEARLLDEFLALVEPPLLNSVLKKCGQNRTAAARILGVNRTTLREKLRRHGLDDSEKP